MNIHKTGTDNINPNGIRNTNANGELRYIK